MDYFLYNKVVLNQRVIMVDEAQTDLKEEVPEEMEYKGWNPRFEELKPKNDDTHEEVPILELKPLPAGLKYTFLREEQSFPVVISSSLTKEQEGKISPQWKHQDRKKVFD